MDIVNETRLRVWKQQPEECFDEAFIDADGTIAPSDGGCQQGVDIAYNGIWGDHPLVVALANTAEPLFLVNRSGNRPSHEQPTVTWTRRPGSAAGRGSARSRTGATRSSPRRGTWTAGTPMASGSSSAWTPGQPQGIGRAPG